MNDKLREILQSPLINIEEVKQLAVKGFSSMNREICWKLLLSYLPPDQSQWNLLRQKRKDNYDSFLHDFMRTEFSESQVQEMKELDSQQQSEATKQRKQEIILSVFPDEKEYLGDLILWEQIEKDIDRTRTDLNFFGNPTKEEYKWKPQYFTTIAFQRIAEGDYQQRHKDVLGRILYVYGKLNPAIKYVQGMNELLSNIYMAYEPSLYHESDVFFSFTILMSIVQENYYSKQEKGEGIKKQLDQLEKFLQMIDPALWHHFQKENINFYYFAYRWLLLLFSHEFSIDHLYVVWDNIFAWKDPKEFALFVAIAILQYHRDQVQHILKFILKILEASFSDILRLLQNLDVKYIDPIIENAHKLSYGLSK